jgi:decaprenyl-phosphate phosphoribosyltransferase
MEQMPKHMEASLERNYLTQIHGLVRLLRPKQWVKNGFVAAPLVFSGEFFNIDAVERTIVAIFLFCLAASATYVLNDLHDVESDRKHPKKSITRPIASGVVSTTSAWILLTCLLVLLGLSWMIQPALMQIISVYMGLTLAYTFSLKNQPVIDLFTIAIGFVLRVYAGAVALTVPVSSWMFVTTLCLALYLAAIKRRQEHRQAGTESRKVLEKYTVKLLDYYAEMSATCALLFYSMFVLSSRPALVLTIPIVLFGLFRYAYIVDIKEDGESPTDALLADWPLIATVGLWIFACIFLLSSYHT